MPALPNLAGVRTKLLERLLVEDQSVLFLTDAEADDCIREALDLINVYLPLQKVAEFAGDGVDRRVVLTDEISDWVNSVSKVLNVSIVENSETDNEVVRSKRKESWDQTISTTDKDVLMLASAIPNGSDLRVNYTIHSEIQDLDSATATTVPNRYTETFYLYALYTSAMSVSMKAARLSQSSFGADQTSLQELHERWSGIAMRKKKQAEERVGSINGAILGVSSSVSWSTPTRFNNGRRISRG